MRGSVPCRVSVLYAALSVLISLLHLFCFDLLRQVMTPMKRVGGHPKFILYEGSFLLSLVFLWSEVFWFDPGRITSEKVFSAPNFLPRFSISVILFSSANSLTWLCMLIDNGLVFPKLWQVQGRAGSIIWICNGQAVVEKSMKPPWLYSCYSSLAFCQSLEWIFGCRSLQWYWQPQAKAVSSVVNG